MTTPLQPLSDAELVRLAELEGKASKGEWHLRGGATPNYTILMGGDVLIVESFGDCTQDGQRYSPDNMTQLINALFIAAARNAMPRLLAELARLREMEKALSKTADGVRLYPGLKVFHLIEGRIVVECYVANGLATSSVQHDEATTFSEFYSTREAADQAKGQP